jgi:hypothetical protein
MIALSALPVSSQRTKDHDFAASRIARHDSRKRQLSLSIPKTSQGSLDGLDVFGLLFGFGVLRLFV